jgi:hypothetical protein
LERSSEVNDILRWAKEADLWMTSDERIAAVERFAALVRADEKEKCAKVCDEMEKRAEGTECCKWPTPADCAGAIRERKS